MVQSTRRWWFRQALPHRTNPIDGRRACGCADHASTAESGLDVESGSGSPGIPQPQGKVGYIPPRYHRHHAHHRRRHWPATGSRRQQRTAILTAWGISAVACCASFSHSSRSASSHTQLSKGGIYLHRSDRLRQTPGLQQRLGLLDQRASVHGELFGAPAVRRAVVLLPIFGGGTTCHLHHRRQLPYLVLRVPRRVFSASRVGRYYSDITISKIVPIFRGHHSHHLFKVRLGIFLANWRQAPGPAWGQATAFSHDGQPSRFPWASGRGGPSRAREGDVGKATVIRVRAYSPSTCWSACFPGVMPLSEWPT